MKKICCIGHITLDKIVNPQGTKFQNGGTSYYFAHGMAKLPNSNFQLVTSLAETEMNAVEELREKGVDVTVFPSRNTVYFENIYGENQDDRSQRVLFKADPFRIEQFQDIDADIFHLGSLLADDFSPELIHELSLKGKVSLDVQGFLREVVDQNVEACDWIKKEEVLKDVYFLKVNELEMKVLTGEEDVNAAAKKLLSWGVKEVLITLGSQGSFVFTNNQVISIPAYPPQTIVDATGCGDTYMTGYLYMWAQDAGLKDAGCFAAAMSTIKLQHFGPFSGTIDDIQHFL